MLPFLIQAPREHLMRVQMPSRTKIFSLSDLFPASRRHFSEMCRICKLNGLFSFSFPSGSPAVLVWEPTFSQVSMGGLGGCHKMPQAWGGECWRPEDEEIVDSRGSQEPGNWTNEGLTRKMSTKERQKLFLVALQTAKGNVSRACDLVQMSRQTYYNWMADEDSDFAELVAEVQFDAVERRIDAAEQKLDDRIELGSGPDIRFLLKTLGAKRGYGKKSEVTINPGAGFKDLEWPEETDDLDEWEGRRDEEMARNQPAELVPDDDE